MTSSAARKRRCSSAKVYGHSLWGYHCDVCADWCKPLDIVIPRPEPMTGGAEAETDEGYRIRILDAMRLGSSMTGCVAGYIRWGYPADVPGAGSGTEPCFLPDRQPVSPQILLELLRYGNNDAGGTAAAHPLEGPGRTPDQSGGYAQGHCGGLWGGHGAEGLLRVPADASTPKEPPIWSVSRKS